MAGSETAARRKRTRELQLAQQQNTDVSTGNQRQKSERQKNRHGTSVNSINKEEEKELAKKLSSPCEVEKIIITSNKNKEDNDHHQILRTLMMIMIIKVMLIV